MLPTYWYMFIILCRRHS